MQSYQVLHYVRRFVRVRECVYPLGGVYACHVLKRKRRTSGQKCQWEGHPEQETNMDEEKRVKVTVQQLGSLVLVGLGSTQTGSPPSVYFDCSASGVVYLATAASNTTSSLVQEAFKRDTSLRKKHLQAHSEVASPGQEISQELVPDPFSIQRYLQKSMLLKNKNQGSSWKANEFGNAQGTNKNYKQCLNTHESRFAPLEEKIIELYEFMNYKKKCAPGHQKHG